MRQHPEFCVLLASLLSPVALYTLAAAIQWRGRAR